MAQQFRPVIEVEGLPPLQHCLRLSISQAIFDHHHFELVVAYEALEGPDGDGFFQTAHLNLCGKRLTISFAAVNPLLPAPAFQFAGIITQLRLGSTNDLASVYILEGYSPTYLLEDSAQRRTFVKQTLPQICHKVLGDYAGNVLSSEVVPRYRALIPYAVQYDENNFTFLKRLAASYGEWLYYTGTRLVIGPPTEAAPVRFVVSGTQSFALTVSLRPTRFKTAEYDYRQHRTLHAASAGQPAASHGTLNDFALQASEQLFPQSFDAGPGPRMSSQGQLDEAVGQLKSSLAGSLVVFEGVGENPNVAVGGLISVHKPTADGRPPADLGQYRILSIEHWLDDAGNYLNKFRAVPAGPGPAPVPWTTPAAGTLELAEVIDLQDPKGLGRIRVRYPWPTADPVAAESSWLRVSTPYSGDGKGQLFTPEVGSQVLVGYEQQRADQPVVLGNLFHARNPQQATYTRPNNHLKGLQTAGGNKLVLDDTAGAQTILLSNSLNKTTAMRISFAGDGSVHIETKGPVTVNGSVITLEAGNEGSISLHAKTIALTAEQELTINSVSKSIALQAGENVLVAATEKMDVQAKEKTITTSHKLEINGGASIDIDAGKVRINP